MTMPEAIVKVAEMLIGAAMFCFVVFLFMRD